MQVMQDSGPVLVEFFLGQEEDRAASKAAGHYVGRDVEFIRITPPGGNLIWEGAVTDTHRQRYERQYQAWAKGLEPPVDGVPLKEWPPASPAQIRTLEAAHIRTVEGLAKCPDGVLQKLGMGFVALREKARTYLDNASNHGKVAEEMEALIVENTALKERLEQLEEAVARMNDKPRRGRPPKDRNAA